MVDWGVPAGFQIILAPPTRFNNSEKTSINPVWYDSLWHVIFAGASTCHSGHSVSVSSLLSIHGIPGFLASYEVPAVAGVAVHYTKTLTDAAQPLRDATPDGGAYQNEVKF